MLHNSGVVLVSASTAEFEITRHLYKTTDISAAKNLGRVLAQRCQEAGITRVYWEPQYGDRNKLRVMFMVMSYCGVVTSFPVIWLQMVMVSPGTHLVKSHQSLSITNESQFKKSRSPKLKMLGPSSNQTVNMETDAKNRYYSFLKLKKKSFYKCKEKKRLKEICIFKQQPQKSLEQNPSILLCIVRDVCHELFGVFGNFYALGT